MDEVTEKKKRKPKELLRSFVFVGDLTASGTTKSSVSFLGYDFVLDGPAVKVRLEVAEKLATHSHWRETPAATRNESQEQK